MSNEIIIHRNRTNKVTVDLGYDVTGETIKSEIRSEPKIDAPLIVAFDVTVTDAATGKLTLGIDYTAASQIKAASGFMDIKRESGVDVLPAFDSPIEVTFQGSVTA